MWENFINLRSSKTLFPLAPTSLDPMEINFGLKKVVNKTRGDATQQ